MSTPSFREVQYLNPRLLGALVLLFLAIGLYAGLAEQRWEPLLTLSIPMAITLLIAWGMRLVTEIRDDVLSVRLTPLPERRIPVVDITSAEPRTYRPILEYGGWGIRYGWRGMAYNAQGNRGVQLVLRDGRRVLIGSKRSEDLAVAIKVATH